MSGSGKTFIDYSFAMKKYSIFITANHVSEMIDLATVDSSVNSLQFAIRKYSGIERQVMAPILTCVFLLARLVYMLIAFDHYKSLTPLQVLLLQLNGEQTNMAAVVQALLQELEHLNLDSIQNIATCALQELMQKYTAPFHLVVDECNVFGVTFLEQLISATGKKCSLLSVFSDSAFKLPFNSFLFSGTHFSISISNIIQSAVNKSNLKCKSLSYNNYLHSYEEVIEFLKLHISLEHCNIDVCNMSLLIGRTRLAVGAIVRLCSTIIEGDKGDALKEAIEYSYNNTRDDLFKNIERVYSTLDGSKKQSELKNVY